MTRFEGAIAHFPDYSQWLARVLPDLSPFDMRRRLHAFWLPFVKGFDAPSFFLLLGSPIATKLLVCDSTVEVRIAKELADLRRLQNVCFMALGVVHPL